jgi:hypothetical protein
VEIVAPATRLHRTVYLSEKIYDREKNRPSGDR